jgi:hypothetical protein
VEGPLPGVGPLHHEQGVPVRLGLPENDAAGPPLVPGIARRARRRIAAGRGCRAASCRARTPGARAPTCPCGTRPRDRARARPRPAPPQPGSRRCAAARQEGSTQPRLPPPGPAGAERG